MSQSSIVGATLLAAFVLFLAARGRLKAYTDVLWGPTEQTPPALLPGAGGAKPGVSGAPEGLGGIAGLLGDSSNIIEGSIAEAPGLLEFLP